MFWVSTGYAYRVALFCCRQGAHIHTSRCFLSFVSRISPRQSMPLRRCQNFIAQNLLPLSFYVLTLTSSLASKMQNNVKAQICLILIYTKQRHQQLSHIPLFPFSQQAQRFSFKTWISLYLMLLYARVSKQAKNLCFWNQAKVRKSQGEFSCYGLQTFTI